MPALTSDIPLGPFEGMAIEVYIGGKSRTSRIHADNSCVANAPSAIMPLNSTTLARMCRQCARWGQWARRETALGIFLDSVQSMPECSREDLEEDYPTAECTRAAELLKVDEYPPEEDEDDLWEDYEQARNLRDSLYSSWRSSRRIAHKIHLTVTLYPWLESWVRQSQEVSEAAVHSLQKLIAQTIDPRSLSIAAFALCAPEPELPVSRSEFSAIWNASQTRQILERCWHEWRRTAMDTHSPNSMVSRAVYAVDSALGRKRNGRNDAIFAAKEMVDRWAQQAHEAARSADSLPCRYIVAQLSESEREDNDPWEHLTSWEIAVVAKFAIDFSWAEDVMLLAVPDLVARCLLDGPSRLRTVELEGNSPLEEFARWINCHVPAQIGLRPGTLDDTSINNRRIITSVEINQLRKTDASLYQVYSTSEGTEVLSISTLAKRCAEGWHGVIVAGPEDLPKSIIDPWINGIEARLEDEVDPLSVRAGEQHIFSRVFNRSAKVVEFRLRVLALVRPVEDLRTLTERYEQPDRHIEWLGLLAPHTLDLTPFMPQVNTAYRISGLDLPLGVLGSAQVYTTDANGHYEGKAHSPFCSFTRSGLGVVDSRFDLLHVRDLLPNKKADWCSVCGGYAVRRLDDSQLEVYHTAHDLLALSQELNWYREWPDSNTGRLAEIRMELQKMARFDPGYCRQFCESSTKWKSVVDSLLSTMVKIEE